MTKWTLAVLLATVAACGSNAVSPQDRLMGKWLYAGSSAGIGLEFDTNNTYKGQLLQETSATTGKDQVETGTFTATDTAITFTPQQSSCPGPIPVYFQDYSFNGDSLVLASSTGGMAFSRNTSPPATNAIITFGCFQSDGSFVQAPLAPVSN